jgi:hypothetical protein
VRLEPLPSLSCRVQPSTALRRRRPSRFSAERKRAGLQRGFCSHEPLDFMVFADVQEANCFCNHLSGFIVSDCRPLPLGMVGPRF